MKVVSIDGNKNKDATQRKEELLSVIDALREQVNNDEINEFVAVSSRVDGALQLHVACFDVITAIGMFEIGKSLMLSDFNL